MKITKLESKNVNLNENNTNDIELTITNIKSTLQEKPTEYNLEIDSPVTREKK